VFSLFLFPGFLKVPIGPTYLFLTNIIEGLITVTFYADIKANEKEEESHIFNDF
jgi:hypothetical protein